MPSYCCSSSDFLQSHCSVLLSSFLLPFSRTSWCCCSFPCISQILRARIFSFSVLFFCRADQECLQWSRVFLLTMFAKDLTGCFSHWCDFKKAFDRVWHAALWATMKKCNISTNLIRVIKNLYDKVTSAFLFNSSIGDWFRTTVGVRQGCLLSPILFNIFLERIMTDALEDHEGTSALEAEQSSTSALLMIFF